jgi:integrase
MPRQSKPHLNKGYYRCRIGGIEHYLGKDRRQAIAKWHRLMADTMSDVPTDQPQTINGVIDRWLALNPKPAYEQWLAQFTAYAGRVYLADVTDGLLTDYLIHLKGFTYHRGKNGPTRHLGNETLRHYIRTATAVLRWAHKRHWIRDEPDVPKLAKPMRRSRDVADARLNEILDSLHKRAGRTLRFIAVTGCRPSEACRLRWRDIRLDVGVCILDEHKTAEETGEPRTIYITPEAAVVLNAVRATVPDAPADSYVFTNRLGKPYKPNGLRSILHRHGGISPYQLRHSFAQRTSDSGKVPVDGLARLMGHTDMKTTAIYFKVRDRRVVEYAKMLRLHDPERVAAG